MSVSRHLAGFAAVLCLLPAAMMPAADCINVVPSPREGNRAVVLSALDSNTKKYGADANMLVRPGLLANRTEKWVKVQAEAVGLDTNSPCEFMLIAEGSGHDYEALFVSFAKPSDIHQALVFIGLPPGRPADGSRCRLWPKGERVIVTVEGERNNGERFHARGESLIVNLKTLAPLPNDGFVFVGSSMKKAPNDPSGKEVYAADAFEPNCIVSYFNDAETVLDVPRIAGQSAVYSFQYPNPAFLFPPGQLVSVMFEPEYKDGRRRVADFTLIAEPPPGPAAATFSNVVIRLTDAAGANAVAGNRLQDTLPVFDQTVSSGRDPFVTVEFDGELPLHVVRDVCKALDVVSSLKGVRIEPPAAGQVFYRAFIPDEKLRNRADRAVQPWEFTLPGSSGATNGSLTLIMDKVNRETERWMTVTNQFEVSTPEALRKALDTKTEDGSWRIGPDYVFIFAPKSTPYKALVPFVTACLETRPYVFVYLE